MQRVSKLIAGLFMLAAPSLRAQTATGAPEPAYMDSVPILIHATLASGATLRGVGATVYLWPATPGMDSVLDVACTAAHAQPAAWLEARTELESPSGLQLDSAAAADLVILRRLIGTPHAAGRADADGHFTFTQVPFGTFWVSAEMLQNGNVVQWWQRFEIGGMSLQLALIMKRKPPTFVPVDLGTSNFTHDEFCTGGEPALGAAAFEVGRRKHLMSATAADSAYTDADQPVVALENRAPDYPVELRAQRLEGTVTVRFVVDATGKVDMRTLQIVESTDFRFTNAVRDVLPRERFQPARIDGHPVRLLTTQSFTFSLGH